MGAAQFDDWERFLSIAFKLVLQINRRIWTYRYLIWDPNFPI